MVIKRNMNITNGIISLAYVRSYMDGYAEGQDNGYETGYKEGTKDCIQHYKPSLSDGLRNGSSICAKDMNRLKKYKKLFE